VFAFREGRSHSKGGGLKSVPRRRKIVKKVMMGLGVLLLSVAQCLFSFPDVQGSTEIEAKKQLDLEGKPLDIGASLDGEKLFILVEGKVLIYSIVQGEILDSIPVSKEFDRLTVPGKESIIALSSSSGKRVEIIRYKILHKIDISRLPFKGPESAPVTIAVFSDYQ
jgi:hypothetical protein